MPTLITGATGFIGARLARDRADAGDTVYAMCRHGADTSFLEHENITIVYGDVTNRDDVTHAMFGCEAVYHLAEFAHGWAHHRDVFDRVNVEGLRNVIHGARINGVGRIVFLSTCLTLSQSDTRPADESDAAASTPPTDYARSKAAAEELARRAARDGIDIVIVQPTRVFGPGPLTETNAVTILVRNYLAGTWRVMPGSGECVANYVFVDDVVRGLHRAMRHGRTGERYVLGGEHVTYRQLFGAVAHICGRQRWMIGLPRPLAMAFARWQVARAHWMKRYPVITPEWTDVVLRPWTFTSEKAQRELGYAITPLHDALTATVRWIESLEFKKRAVA